MKAYINSKIKDIEMKTNLNYSLQSIVGSNSNLKRSWKREQNISDKKWCEINTNQDIYALIETFESYVNQVEMFEKVVIEDEYNMMLRLYNVLQGLRKLAQCMDSDGEPWGITGFTEVTIEEVDTIFFSIEEITSRMEKQIMRKMMQD